MAIDVNRGMPNQAGTRSEPEVSGCIRTGHDELRHAAAGCEPKSGCRGSGQVPVLSFIKSAVGTWIYL